MTNNTAVSFTIWDALFAVFAHILIASGIMLALWWQAQHIPDKPVLKHIEVTMISAKELKKWQHKKPPKPKPHEVQTIQPEVKTKPRPHINPHLTPKPVLQPKLKPQPKPQPKKAHQDVKKTREDPNFDPFAPIQSTSDVAPKKHTKKKPDIAAWMEQQLSQKEIEQYIHRMQRAVQQHWKVPGGIADNIPDPLVEMILKPNGEIVRIRILESSGDPTFDQTLIAAIHAAAPFNLPQQQFESFRKNQIRFHPL